LWAGYPGAFSINKPVVSVRSTYFVPLSSNTSPTGLDRLYKGGSLLDPVEDTSLRVCVASQWVSISLGPAAFFILINISYSLFLRSYKTVIGANGYHGRDRYGMVNLGRRAYMGQRPPSVFA